MSKIIKTKGNKYTVEIDRIEKVERTITLEEVKNRKAKLLQKKERYSTAMDEVDNELDELEAILTLIDVPNL